jgi:hypothetical protein
MCANPMQSLKYSNYEIYFDGFTLASLQLLACKACGTLT